jgi:hypothetical protein
VQTDAPIPLPKRKDAVRDTKGGSLLGIALLSSAILIFDFPDTTFYS